jgi:hypothetical protein
VTWLVSWLRDWTNDALIGVYTVEATVVYLSRRRYRATVEVRRRAAARIFKPEMVAEAAELARSCPGAIMLHVPVDGGWAWWTCRSVPTGDLIINTGWCRRRRQLSRLLDRASDEAAANR